MTANPVELIGGLTSTANVAKADIVGWAKARVPQVLANAAEINNTTLANQLVVFLKSNGHTYYLDTSDGSTPDDGLSCIISFDGFRFKVQSDILPPTTLSLGGVFASAAVPTRYVIGLDTSGNLLRAQPAATDLSNGVTGTGAVVLAVAPTVGILTATQVLANNGGGGTGASFVSSGTAAAAVGWALTGGGVDAKTWDVLVNTNTLSLRAVNDANNAATSWLTAVRSGMTISSVSFPSSAVTFGTAGSVGGSLIMSGATSGAVTLNAPAIASGTLTLPATTDTLVARSTTDTLTNKSLDASANTITNLTTAMFAANVVDTDATLAAASTTRLATQSAVKSYVDNNLTGLSWKAAAIARTTGTLPANTYSNGASGAGATLTGNANGALSAQDGVTLTAGQRLLVANEATGANNGLYALTQLGDASHPYILTRATDMDAAAEFPSATVFVEKGTVNGDTQWTCTNDPTVVVGTTAIAFAQVSGAGTYSAGTGLLLSGNQFSIDSTVVATLTGAQALTNKTFNGNTWTAGTGTLTLGAGKTVTISNTLTFAGTDASSIAFGAGGTVVYTSNNLSVFAATTSAQLAGVISDETGSGALVFAGSPTLTGTPLSTTAAVDTNTTQIATTAFVLGQASAAAPLGDLASSAIGTSTRYARADHVHPGREVLTANRTYYVSTTGNDSNTGLSSGAAFLTVQKALNVIIGNLDLAGFTVTVQLVDGTHTDAVSVTQAHVGGGSIVIQGNVSTPGNVIWSGSSGNATLYVETNSGITIQYLDVGSTVGQTLYANLSSKITVGAGVRFVSSASAHMLGKAGGVVFVPQGTSYTIKGGANFHIYATSLGSVISQVNTISVLSAPAFVDFALSEYNAAVLANSNTYTFPTCTISIASPGVITYTGHGMVANQAFALATTGALPTGLTAGTTYYVKTVVDANNFTASATPGGTVINTSGTQSGVHSVVATGTRYSATSGSVILALGGANYFPGNAAGSTATNGQYL